MKTIESNSIIEMRKRVFYHVSEFVRNLPNLCSDHDEKDPECSECTALEIEGRKLYWFLQEVQVSGEDYGTISDILSDLKVGEEL